MKDYDFGEQELFTADIVIFGQAGETRSDLTLKDLEGQTVGVTNAYGYGDEFEKNTKIIKESAIGDIHNLKKLASGRIKYFVVYEKVAKHLIGINKALWEGKVKKIGFIKSDKLYVNFSKKFPDSQKYLKLLDQGLAKVKADGRYAKLEKGWDDKINKGE